MLTTFLTASAISALIILLSNTAYVKLPARKNTSYGWFGAYDANVVGGLLQGVGMAVTGACPGTGIVQRVVGVSGAGWVLLGGVLGGLGFVGFEKARTGRGKGEVKKNERAVPGHTVMERTGVSESVAVLGYEAMLVGMIVLAGRIGLSPLGERGFVHPVVGGCMIGGAQAMSVLFAKKTLGVSSAYSEIATHATSLVKSGEFAKTGFGNIAFAVGVGLGAKLVVSSRGAELSAGAAGATGLSVPMALVGGFASIFGARMAGGCTSGHGISGMSTLSISSFVTVCGMFGGGIVVRLLMNAM